MTNNLKFIESYYHIENYYNVDEINTYFDKINDDLSGGPKTNKSSAYGYAGCWDTPLRLENIDNPIHKLLDKLKQSFGDFDLIPNNASIRHLSHPFTVHDDTGTRYILIDFLKSVGAKRYLTFLIPLSWQLETTPGTAFFSSPPKLHEPLYREKLDILPHYSEEKQSEMAKYSVSAIFKWKNPGDLIAWKDFVFHSTLDSHTYKYSLEPDGIAKKFISMRVYQK